MNEWNASAQVKVAVTEDGRTEVCVPWMDEPLVLAPGEQIMLGVGVVLATQSYIEGVGWQ